MQRRSFIGGLFGVIAGVLLSPIKTLAKPKEIKMKYRQPGITTLGMDLASGKDKSVYFLKARTLGSTEWKTLGEIKDIKFNGVSKLNWPIVIHDDIVG